MLRSVRLQTLSFFGQIVKDTPRFFVLNYKNFFCVIHDRRVETRTTNQNLKQQQHENCLLNIKM